MSFESHSPKKSRPDLAARVLESTLDAVRMAKRNQGRRKWLAASTMLIFLTAGALWLHPPAQPEDVDAAPNTKPAPMAVFVTRDVDLSRLVFPTGDGLEIDSFRTSDLSPIAVQTIDDAQLAEALAEQGGGFIRVNRKRALFILAPEA